MKNLKLNERKKFIGNAISASQGYSDVFPKREIWKEIVEIYKGEFKIIHNSGQELKQHNIIIHLPLSGVFT